MTDLGSLAAAAAAEAQTLATGTEQQLGHPTSSVSIGAVSDAQEFADAANVVLAVLKMKTRPDSFDAQHVAMRHVLNERMRARACTTLCAACTAVGAEKCVKPVSGGQCTVCYAMDLECLSATFNIVPRRRFGHGNQSPGVDHTIKKAKRAPRGAPRRARGTVRGPYAKTVSGYKASCTACGTYGTKCKKPDTAGCTSCSMAERCEEHRCDYCVSLGQTHCVFERDKRCVRS